MCKAFKSTCFVLKNICKRLALRKVPFWENVLFDETKWWKYEWISKAPLVKSTQKDLVSSVPVRGFPSEAVVCRCSFKMVSKKFRQFRRKTPVLESPFNKVTHLKTAKFLKAHFFTDPLRWLLLFIPSRDESEAYLRCFRKF